jgi:hypothetical protein
MMLDAKTAWSQTPQIPGTALHVKDAATRRALKVMVVARSGSLIARTVTGQRDRGNRALGQQQLEIAIHRGQAKSRDLGARGNEDLLWSQRAPCGFDRVPDRIALARGPFEGHDVAPVTVRGCK